MGVQLLDDVLGAAIGVLIHSLFCLACSSVMVWLVWVHQERDSYVAFLSYFTFLSTGASIVQQLITTIWWRDVKIEEWENAVAHPGKAEVAIASTSTGVNLVLFYIQYYSYNVLALLTLFWAMALTQSVYGFVSKVSFKTLRLRTNHAVKSVAIALPALLIGLLQLDVIQTRLVAFLILANINIMASLTIGSILLIAVLGKYVHTRQALLTWNVKYGNSTSSQTTATGSSVHLSSNVHGQNQSIYDQWLVVRFTIAFIALGIFELTMIYFEVNSLRKNSTEALANGPDLTAATATLDFILFMPGVSASILVFVVFGTTKTFRDTVKNVLVIKWFRRKPLDMNCWAPPQFQHSSQGGNSQGATASRSPYDNEPLSPTDHELRIIRMRELKVQYSSVNEDDEWPILPAKTAPRVNDNPV